VALKGGGKQVSGEVVWGLLIFMALCVFGCVSFVVVEGACVRDCRRVGVV
jgi:hypothetical protein